MNPNTVDLMTPTFAKNFVCAADKCPDHCCHSWEVAVDKKSFKNLKKSNNLIVKQLANEHLKLTRKSQDNWGAIKMNPDGNCPFLDKNRLCEIHKNCGHQALSHTCQSYPRAYLWFGQQIEASLSISCPSAAKALLFDPSAMMFDVQASQPHQINNGQFAGYINENLPSWMPVLRNACFNIVLYDQIPVEERLFSIGMLLKQAEKYLLDVARLEQLIANIEEMITDGSLSKMYQDLSEHETVKWLVFVHQDKKLERETLLFGDNKDTLSLSTSAQRFDECRQAMIKQFNQRMLNAGEQGKPNLVFTQLLKDAKPLLDNYFEQQPQVLINYLLYYFYHNQFMFNANKSPFEFFKVLCVDLFNLKAYLSGIALEENTVTDDWVLLLFQSYARRRQHEANFVQNMEAQLDASGTNTAGAIFSLLKI